MRLSPKQRDWLETIMSGTYEHEDFYKELWVDIQRPGQIGQRIVCINEIPLQLLCESVVDRVNNGDKDKEAYRDKKYAQRILEKL